MTTNAASPTPRRPRKVGIFIAGVLIPTASLLVELIYHVCAQVLFDPIPSVFHMALVASMPLFNFWVLRAVVLRQPARLRLLSILNGVTIGVSLFYSILFAPVSPIAVIGIIFMGVGLLPLGPLFSLMAALSLRFHLKRLAQQHQSPPLFWPGFALGICLLLGAELPSTTTRIGLSLADSDSPALNATGIAWLRAIGSEEQLLRHCYPNARAATDLIGALFIWSDPIPEAQAQTIYFRVTGKAYNTEPRPTSQEKRRGWRSRWNNWDTHRGGTTVGDNLDGLQIAASRMDASVDAEAAVAYLEWIMVFRNDSTQQQEARTQISLPPGAVISRVTLWVDGEEREAAFAGKREVRAAYQKVVRQQRDPVLVTSAGQDRALVQLFPVPPQGEMKVRIGMSVPLRMPGEKESLLSLPYFHERNFTMPPGFKHALWVDSKAALYSPATAARQTGDNYSLRTELEDAQLIDPTQRIHIPRAREGAAWAPDIGRKDFLIRQTLTTRAANAPKQLIIIADASTSMREAAPRLGDALKHLPQGMELRLIIAEEGAHREPLPVETLNPAALETRLRNLPYRGGHNNLPALFQGFALAAQQEDSAILWLHGPQPIYPGSVEPLLQPAERQAKLPRWYDLQVTPGANQIVEALDGRVASTSLLPDDLAGLIASWQPGQQGMVRTLERMAAPAGEFHLLREKTSKHLARLWANEEIRRLIARQAPRDAMISLAQDYQLVTPISGAVVLETQQQYDEAGLQPAPSGSVPTIPEPETWMLISVALSALGWQARRAKRKANDARL